MSDTEPPSTSDRLAHERTGLAGNRTVMAADRTLMAWIRTALAMIGFGFTIYKFMQVLLEAEVIHLHRPNSPRNLGLILTLLGTGSLVAGIIQHMQILRKIGVSTLRSVTFYVACSMVVLGLVIFVGIAIDIGDQPSRLSRCLKRDRSVAVSTTRAALLTGHNHHSCATGIDFDSPRAVSLPRIAQNIS